MAESAFITIKKEKCKGCSLCIVSCAQQLIKLADGEMNALGYAPAVFDDQENKCKACKLCAEMCPDCCIEVYRPRKENGK